MAIYASSSDSDSHAASRYLLTSVQKLGDPSN